MEEMGINPQVLQDAAQYAKLWPRELDSPGEKEKDQATKELRYF